MSKYHCFNSQLQSKHQVYCTTRCGIQNHAWYVKRPFIVACKKRKTKGCFWANLRFSPFPHSYYEHDLWARILQSATRQAPTNHCTARAKDSTLASERSRTFKQCTVLYNNGHIFGIISNFIYASISAKKRNKSLVSACSILIYYLMHAFKN